MDQPQRGPSLLPPLQVLYTDNHLLVVAKPAGLLVQGDHTGDPTLVDLARDYRRATEHKPGNVYVGLVHRLDRPVSGVVVLAKTSKAAARLSAQFRDRAVQKTYLGLSYDHRGLAAPIPGPPTVWTDHLRKDAATNTVRVVAAGAGQEAVTQAEPLARAEGLVLWRLQPQTGRPHQLRVQAAAHGYPLVGDQKYGPRPAPALRPRPWPAGSLALHAHQLQFTHPTTHVVLTVTAALPATWLLYPVVSASCL